MSRSGVAAGIAFLPLLASCGSDQARTVLPPLERDSAGVTVVVSETPQWRSGEGFEVGRRPALSIGGVDGEPEQLFGYVTGATRLSDGRIITTDGTLAEVRSYADDGSFLERWGNRGQGPGEFNLPAFVRAIDGDSVVVVDLAMAAATAFDPQGRFVRRVRAQFDYSRSEGEAISQSCCIPLDVGQGWALWAYPDRWSTEGSGPRPSEVTVVRTALESEISTDTIGTFESGVATPDGLVRGTTKTSAVTDGELVYIGSGKAYGYQVWAPDGRLLRVTRAVKARPEVDDAWIEEYVEASRERISGSPELSGEQARQILERSRYADSLPAYSDIHVDPTGHVWLGEWLNPNTYRSVRREYQVFNEEGHWLGAVRMPEGILVREIGLDYVLGLRRGDLDEHYVEVFDLRRPGTN